jgi:hypothetical protein
VKKDVKSQIEIHYEETLRFLADGKEDNFNWTPKSFINILEDAMIEYLDSRND